MQENSQVSISTASILEPREREKPRSCDHPMGGGMLGKTQQNSDIVLLCIYFLSNYCKNIQNIKNCWVLPTPPTGGGVWCDTPAVKLEPPLTRWCDWNEVNKYGGSRPWGQSLLRYQPVCLWYHYTPQLRSRVVSDCEAPVFRVLSFFVVFFFTNANSSFDHREYEWMCSLQTKRLQTAVAAEV